MGWSPEYKRLTTHKMNKVNTTTVTCPRGQGDATPRQQAIHRALYDLNLVYGRGQVNEGHSYFDGTGLVIAHLQYGVSKFRFRVEHKSGDRITVFARGHQTTVSITPVDEVKDIICTAACLGILVAETTVGLWDDTPVYDITPGDEATRERLTRKGLCPHTTASRGREEVILGVRLVAGHIGVSIPKDRLRL